MTTYASSPCMLCGQSTTMDLPEEQMRLWRDGMLIQHAFPDLSTDERELILTGTHSDCWDQMIGPDQ